MDNNKLDPTKSKCHSCKHGLSTLQENTAFIEANFPMGGGPPGMFDAPDEPHIDWDGDAEEDEDSEPKKIVESRLCSMCYWHPSGQAPEAPIIHVALVKECSRYEKRDD